MSAEAILTEVRAWRARVAQRNLIRPHAIWTELDAILAGEPYAPEPERDAGVSLSRTPRCPACNAWQVLPVSAAWCCIACKHRWPREGA